MKARQDNGRKTKGMLKGRMERSNPGGGVGPIPFRGERSKPRKGEVGN